MHRRVTTRSIRLMTEGERLQKVLARIGYGSRRICEELIEEGRVAVNGEVAVLGRRVDVLIDAITVDGVPVGVRPDFVYYLLNKPVGVICTASDTHGRETVLDLVPDSPRVFTVGRLDMESEGLIILTNDGELANAISHPRSGLEKEYLVEVRNAPHGVSQSAIRRLREGIELEDGLTAPADVSQPTMGVLRVTLHEGKNRQIRRMCEAVGHNVERLVRVRIGPLRDSRLKPGEYRHLTAAELRLLRSEIASTIARGGKNRPRQA